MLEVVSPWVRDNSDRKGPHLFQPEAQRPPLIHLRNTTSKGHNGESQKLGSQALSRQQVYASCRSTVFHDSTKHGWAANFVREQRGTASHDTSPCAE